MKETFGSTVQLRALLQFIYVCRPSGRPQKTLLGYIIMYPSGVRKIQLHYMNAECRSPQERDLLIT